MPHIDDVDEFIMNFTKEDVYILNDKIREAVMTDDYHKKIGFQLLRLLRDHPLEADVINATVVALTGWSLPTYQKMIDAINYCSVDDEMYSDERLFLLSADEAEQYMTDEQRRGGNWWLRSPAEGGCNIVHLLAVLVSGSIIDRLGEIIYKDWGVRPAMYLDVESQDAHVLSILHDESNTFELGHFEDEPISWYLLNRQTGLCVATKALYLQIFNDEDNNVYETSAIRKSLRNDVGRMFNSKERAMLVGLMVDRDNISLVPPEKRHSPFELLMASAIRERKMIP